MSAPGAVALVTGAGARIGRALALELAARGYAVAVHHLRSAAAAGAVVAEIEAAGGRAHAFAADLADEDQTRALAANAQTLGPLTCLVNNASVFEYDTIATATRESWESHMAVNLRAPLVLAQAFAASLPKDRDGVIVNIIDQRVLNLTPHFLSYTLSKSGLWTLTRRHASASTASAPARPCPAPARTRPLSPPRWRRRRWRGR